MRAVAAGVSDVGKERDHNEDRFILLPEFDVYVVADGMGGHQCGEVASRMATSSIAKFFRSKSPSEHDSNTAMTLRASVEDANRRIFERAINSPSHRGMGTTVVAAAFHRGQRKFYVAHAGDSRCYRMRAGTLLQLTRDHSLIEEALRSRPGITKAELAYLPSNVITRALGVDSSVEPDVAVDEVLLGDVYLLCSDGLHGFVTDERIAEIVRALLAPVSSVTPSRARPALTDVCADLVAEANKNGGGDNITAVLVRIEAVDDPWSKVTSFPPRPGSSVVPPEVAAALSPVPAAPRVPSFAPSVPEGDGADRSVGGFSIEDAPTEALLTNDDSTTQRLPAKGLPRFAGAALPPSFDEPTVTNDDE